MNIVMHLTFLDAYCTHQKSVWYSSWKSEISRVHIEFWINVRKRVSLSQNDDAPLGVYWVHVLYNAYALHRQPHGSSTNFEIKQYQKN